jgi:hypothetical protein
LETLLPKLAIALFLSVVAFFLWTKKDKFMAFSAGNESLTVILGLLGLRILPFILIYLVLGYTAKSDVLMFFDWAEMAKAGAIIYKDFPSPYAPLFSYVTAIPLFLWHTPEALVLLMIMVECLAVWISYKYLLNHKESHFYAILYLLMPSSMVLSVLGGQEDVWIWLFFVLSILAYKKWNSSVVLGIGMGFGLVFTKVLFILLLPFSFFWIKDKVKFVLGLLLVGIPTLSILYSLGQWSFLLPIQQANDPRTPNIWSILNPFFNVYHNFGIKVLNYTGLLSLVWAGVYIVLKKKQVFKGENIGLILAFITTFMVMMLVQQSSLANYIYMYLLAMILYVAPTFTKKQFILLLVLSIATVVQPAIWWGLKMPIYKSYHELQEPLKLIEYLLEILIVACLLYFCIYILSLQKKDFSLNRFTSDQKL